MDLDVESLKKRLSEIIDEARGAEIRGLGDEAMEAAEDGAGKVREYYKRTIQPKVDEMEEEYDEFPGLTATDKMKAAGKMGAANVRGAYKGTLGPTVDPAMDDLLQWWEETYGEVPGVDAMHKLKGLLKKYGADPEMENIFREKPPMDNIKPKRPVGPDLPGAGDILAPRSGHGWM